MPRSFPRVIDSTMLSTLACHRKWQWSYESNFTPREGKSVDLMAGAAFAKGGEIMRLCYVQGKASMLIHDPHDRLTPPRRFNFETSPGDIEEALEAGVLALTYAYDTDCAAFDSPKTLERMCGALEFYADKYPLDNPAYGKIATLAGRPGVEWNFCVPLPIRHPDTGEPLLLAGRTDQVLKIFSGLYLEDDKTTTRLGPSWASQWDMRGQFACYTWAARQLGLPISGTLVRGVSILKNGYDTAQVLIDQPDWKCDEWLRASVNKLQHAIILYRSGLTIPAFNDECNSYGGCEFKKICLTKDHEGWLVDSCYERNWDPLETH